MSLFSRLLGSSDPAAYAGRESATHRAARKAAERAAKGRDAARQRRNKAATKTFRDAADRGWW